MNRRNWLLSSIAATCGAALDFGLSKVWADNPTQKSVEAEPFTWDVAAEFKRPGSVITNRSFYAIPDGPRVLSFGPGSIIKHCKFEGMDGGWSFEHFKENDAPIEVSYCSFTLCASPVFTF